MTSLKLLSGKDFCLSSLMPGIIPALRESFKNNPNIIGERDIFDIEESNGLFLSPPFYSRDGKLFGSKLSTIYRDNPEKGRSLTNSIVVNFSYDSGEPNVIIDGNFLTLLRTGGVSGLATDILSSANSTELSIIGSGTQAIAQVISALTVRPTISKINLWSRNILNAKRLEESIKKLPIFKGDVNVYESIEEAVKNSDIICTVTSKMDDRHLVDYSWVKDSCHLNVIGGSSVEAVEIDPLFFKPGRVFVEKISSAVRECAEIKIAIDRKYILEQDVLSINDLVNKQIENSDPSRGGTVFRSVGTPLLDVVASSYLIEYARMNTIGNEVVF